jgi:hypothetical protein
LAMAMHEALPGWVTRREASFCEQYASAKAVGEMVTDYGQKVATAKLVGLGILPGPPPPSHARRRPAAQPPSGAAPDSLVADPPASESDGPAIIVVANGRSAPAGAPTPATDPADLSIPGYDSLSASQVVSRLAGLAATELEAVRVYEAASRGRRTILTKIAQLQAERA